MTLREQLQAKDNDYSRFEPFRDPTPITTTIITPAYNKPELLRYTLNSLNQNREIQHSPDLFNLVIVDDASQEDISSVIVECQVTIRHQLVLHSANEGPASARNTGIKYATGELIVFLDSDMLIPTEYFQAHWQVHNACDNAIALGFAENIQEGDDISDALKRMPIIDKDFRFKKELSLCPDGDGPQTFYLMRDTNQFRHFGNGKNIGFWTLPYMVVTHNMSVRKSRCFEVGGLDTRFRGWGLEDTFFGAKLIANGAYVIPVLSSGAFRIKHAPRKSDGRTRSQEMLDNMKLYEAFLDEKNTPRFV
ncbi:MAG TPA: glycosyltransferase [Candidatus Nanoarchaeia archaeon]|nr:glycosyltransferase [Candidatus Nanoarchaeia archaeon]